MKPTPTTLALRLAARSCGTNTHELCERLGVALKMAAGTLSNLVVAGRVHRVEGQTQPQGIVLHQYFTSKAHADAWAKLAPMYRPNVRLKKSSANKPHRAKLKRRDPDVSIPSPFTGTKPVLDGCNGRYSVPETFRGEFSSMKPGQYIDEAASCAARAAKW